jgi:phosphatidylglycerol---prolipoprotein diacylglyceryl transferase
MHPVLTVLRWRGADLPIGSYGVLLALAVVVGSVVTVRRAARSGLDEGAVVSALAGAIGVGFACAYLAASLVGWARTGSLAVGLARPAIMFYGGAIGGAVAYAALAWRLGLRPAEALDVALPGLPLAHALGRAGCLLGGCCFGAASELPWAVVYTHPLAPAAIEAVPRHPWPAYEALALLALAVLLSHTRLAAGERAAWYVLLYAAVRGGLEALRGDAVRGVLFGVSVGQLCALATGLAAAGFLLQRTRRRRPRSPRAGQSSNEAIVPRGRAV